jgi:hypothetical protein
LAVIVRLAGLVAKLGVTDSQFPVLLALVLKLVPLTPLMDMVWVTGLPDGIPETFAGLGVATRPDAVPPGASTVMGIVNVELDAPVEVRTRLPVFSPGASWLAVMPIPMVAGVVVVGAL